MLAPQGGTALRADEVVSDELDPSSTGVSTRVRHTFSGSSVYIDGRHSWLR